MNSPESKPENTADIPEQEKAVGFVYTSELAPLFYHARLALLVTTYQAQRVMLFSAVSPEKISMLMRVFPRPTGLALDENRMALCCKHIVWIFRTGRDIADKDGQLMPYDLVFLPRQAHVTGDIAAHQALWHHGQLYLLNTRFSCVSTLDERWSFVPGWRPHFITACTPEDRCHLNGFCSDGQTFRYATALGATDTEDGWRANKTRGGVVIDMPAGELLCSGLCMPHNPMLYAGRLWILESGTGSVLTVDQQSGETTVAARLPGFLRGLAFYDRFAFVGLCQAREKNMFGGLPVEQSFPELECAVYVLDIHTGATRGFIKFTKGIEELFDIATVVGPRAPHSIGLEDDAIESIMIPPPDSVRLK